MRKLFALILTLALAVSAFTLSASAEAAEGVKLGLNVDTTVSGSKDAGDEDGLAQVESVAVAVLVDAEGKILDVDIDAVQTNMPFTAEGKLGDGFPAEAQTRRELGDAYGMGKASQIGEWYQQIDALCQYLIGKTAEEVQGVAVAETPDAELTAGCTMYAGGFLNCVAAAMEKAVPCDAKATDKVGLGVETDTHKSKEAADGKDGLCQAYSFFSATAVGEDGVITACLLDSTQGSVNFDATGKITSDLTARTATKQELGDAYGMRAASGIGKEWNEQADAFAAYALGKTAEEVAGIALTEDGHAADTELAASVTVSAGSLRNVVAEAAANAQ